MFEWQDFQHADAAWQYQGDRLAAHWADLHRGDREPFPDEAWVTLWLREAPQAAPEAFDGDIQGLAASLQAAWRCFHAGQFGAAVEAADRCGLLAAACANKATGIYATYLETDSGRQQACFRSAIERAERACQHLAGLANSHYFHAFNLGRLSQSMSVMKALRQGLGGKIKASLERTLALEAGHAEAHTALGLYHAEVVNKVGKMIGALTYGASAEQALEHFQTALKLNPDSPIAHIEYGNGLYLLYGDRELDRVTELYLKASEMQARDAMEQLDIKAAAEELE